MKSHTSKSRSAYRKFVFAGLSAAWIAGLATLALTAGSAHAF